MDRSHICPICFWNITFAYCDNYRTEEKTVTYKFLLLPTEEKYKLCWNLKHSTRKTTTNMRFITSNSTDSSHIIPVLCLHWSCQKVGLQRSSYCFWQTKSFNFQTMKLNMVWKSLNIKTQCNKSTVRSTFFITVFILHSISEFGPFSTENIIHLKE